METVTISRAQYNEYIKLKEMIGENVTKIVNPSTSEKKAIDEALKSGSCSLDEAKEVEKILNS